VWLLSASRSDGYQYRIATCPLCKAALPCDAPAAAPPAQPPPPPPPPPRSVVVEMQAVETADAADAGLSPPPPGEAVGAESPPPPLPPRTPQPAGAFKRECRIS